MKALALFVLAMAAVLADLRWLRVAQREHYLAGTVSLFAKRWWLAPWYNAAMALLAVVGSALVLVTPAAAAVPALVLALGPIGLGVRGRTSKLAWTLRLKTLTLLVGAAQLLVVLVGAAAGHLVLGAVIAAVAAPMFVDLALVVAKPIEERRAGRFVRSAEKRLRSVAPTVVGITGSYGKTSTKNFVGQLLEGRRSTVLTPASFNNRAGLSRSINEHLTVGTEVFVAEMGTYGPGEIAELCRLCPPDISVFTAVGPVHLERFGSEDAIVVAKSEIFPTARVAVLSTDDPRLDAVATRLQKEGKTVWRCSTTDVNADVCLRPTSSAEVDVFVKGARQGRTPMADVPVINVACAIAVALELDVDINSVMVKLAALKTPAHRQEVSVTPEGVTVIDDTYNANPAGVRRGLQVLAAAGEAGSRRVVVTPGMVELGPRQDHENEELAVAAGSVATDLVIVGRTNRRALRRGAERTSINIVEVGTLPEAVAWVRKHVGKGDAVLYANDLPDHFA